MSSKLTSSQEKTATKQQAKLQPTVEPLAVVAEFAGESLLFGGQNLQTSRFGDARFSAIQRQKLARKVGQIHGNGYLQNILLNSLNSHTATLVQRDCTCNNRTPTTDLCDNCKKKRERQSLETTLVTQRRVNDAGLYVLKQQSEAQLQRDIIQRDELYNITIGNQTLQNATADQVINRLRFHYRIISGRVESGREMHQYLIDLRNEQWIVGAISETLGGVRMPSIGIWAAPHVALNAVQETLNAGLIEPTIRNLQRAEKFYQDCHRQVIEYRDGSIGGAETSITVLEVTAAAGAVAATVATGGAASAAGMGLLGSSATTSFVAGSYGMTQQAAGQASELHYGLRQDFDIAAILRRGAIDAVTNFVGAFTGGALSQYMNRFFGSYLSRSAPELLEELGRIQGLSGPLPRDFFLTNGQRFISEFLSGIGTTPLTSAIQTVLNRLTGGTRELPSPHQFARQVFDEMVQGGAIQLFIGMLTHGLSRGTSHSAHETAVTEHTTRTSESPSSETSSTRVEAVASDTLATEGASRTNELSQSKVRNETHIGGASGETHTLKFVGNKIYLCTECMEAAIKLGRRLRIIQRHPEIIGETNMLSRRIQSVYRDSNQRSRSDGQLTTEIDSILTKLVELENRYNASLTKQQYTQSEQAHQRGNFESTIGRKVSQKQLRHIENRSEWKEKQGSYFKNMEDAQRVLDAYHSGKATILGRTKQGHMLVKFEGVTGYNNNPGAGFTDQPTNVFMIKGTSNPSVVPVSPTRSL